VNSVGYPIGDPTPTFEDNQGTIKSIKASWLNEKNHHLATFISLLNEQYTMDIIKIFYTKTALQLSDCNNKPLCGQYLQSIITYVIGVHNYTAPYSKHYQALYLDVCRLFTDYLKNRKPIPVTSSRLV
jgi:hypothetical protein